MSIHVTSNTSLSGRSQEYGFVIEDLINEIGKYPDRLLWSRTGGFLARQQRTVSTTRYYYKKVIGEASRDDIKRLRDRSNITGTQRIGVIILILIILRRPNGCFI